MKLLLVFLLVALLAALASSQRLLQAARSLGLVQLASSGLLFLLLGAAAGPTGLQILTRETLVEVQPLIALGLGVGGLLIGLNLAPALLRQLPRRAYFAALAQSGTAFLAVAAITFPLLWKALAFSFVGSLGAAAVLGGAASVSSAHLAILWVRTGRIERLRGLGVVLLATLDDWLGLAVLACALALAATATIGQGVLLVLLALAVGTLCGFLLAFLVRDAEGGELPAILIGSVALVAGAAAFLKISALLAGFACGATLSLIGGKSTERLYGALSRIERPVYLVLIFLLGAHWRLADWPAWVLLPVFVGVRFFGKITGGRLAARVGREAVWLPPEPGYALLGQGGVAVCVVAEYLLLVARPSSPLIFDVVVMAAVVNEVIANSTFGRSLAPRAQGVAPETQPMMDAALRLGLLIALLAAISGLVFLRSDLGTPVTLAAGALLLCGIFAGKVAKQLGLPRLTGYLLIGVAVGPFALGFIPKEGVKGLELVKGLAVSLIALAAGLELHLALVKRVGARALALCALVVTVVFVACCATVIAIRPWVSFLAGMSWPQTLAVASLLSSVVVSFSPTVTIAVVQEMRARGSFTEFLMALVILGDVLVLVVFAVSAGLVRASQGGAMDLGGLAAGIGWELFGSMVIGALLGVGTIVYLRKVGREVPVFISALCFAAAEGGAKLHLSPLLLSLAAGAVVANLDPRSGHRLHEAVQKAGLPVFALFFAAAGAGLHLDALGKVGAIAIVLVLVRAAAIFFSSRQFAPKSDPRLGRLLWMGLISQAGVTFGLASLISRTFPTFGPEMEVLIVAMVTIHELVGPLLMRRALVQSGDAHPEPDTVPERV